MKFKLIFISVIMLLIVILAASCDESREKETAGGEESINTEKITSIEETTAIEETTSIKETAAVEETVSVEETTAIEETTSTKETAAVEETGSVEETTETEETTTVEETTVPKETCDMIHEIVFDGADGHYETACGICKTASGEPEAHTYPKTGDYKCSICGFVPTCGRDHSSKWVQESDGHSMLRCDECGKAPVDKKAHIFDTLSGGVYACTVCKYVPGAAEFNRDLEHLIIDKKTNELQFIHFADIHRGLTAWNRVVDYYNEYSEYIDFAIHTGDYVGAYNSPEGGNYRDLYTEGTQSIKPIYNAVGNHDIYSAAGGGSRHDKEGVTSTLFNKTDNWNVTFMGNASVNTSYFRDFEDQKVRLIVLDNYFDEAGQIEWLEELLYDAKEKGYHVLTAMHEPTAKIVTPIDTVFNSQKAQTSAFRTSAFDKVLGDFIKDGGSHIANLTGHWHVDYMGYTENGVLNISVEIGSAGAVGAEQLDGRYQFVGKRQYDAFNVVTVNVDEGTFEIIRIGNNTDSLKRNKTSLKYDYINKTVIEENQI